MSRIVGLLSALIVLVWAQPLHAQVISWNFSGTMDDTGEQFAGFVSFDSQTPDHNSSLPRGQYNFVTISEGDLAFTLNGDLVFADPVHADGRVPDRVGEADILDDVDASGDLIRFTYNVLITPPQVIPGLQEYVLDLFFVDETGAWLSNASLPTGPVSITSLILDPMINGWGDRFGLTSPAALRLRTFTTGVDTERFGTITSWSRAAAPPIQVTIDIQPRSDTNTIKLFQRSVPVAILTTSTFDAASVDPTTVTLDGASVRMKGRRASSSMKDVDKDKDKDLVIDLLIEQMALTPGDVEAVLRGTTFGGTMIQGTDTIQVVP